MSIKGLSAEQSESLRQAILQRESSGNYQAVNQIGFIGGYQFGAPALEDLGLVKKGVGALGNRALDNPNNWTIPGGKQAFLNNPQLQDQSFQRLTNLNHSRLTRLGVINPNTPPGDVSGYLATSHLLGPGGARNLANGKVGADANGTTATSYFSLGKRAATGAAGGPSTPPTAPGTAGGASGPSSGPNTQTPAELGPLGNTGIGDTVTIGLTPTVGGDDVPLPIPNPLTKFVTFNYIFTLSALSNYQVNFPDSTYKAGDLGRIVLRSGGGFSSNRVPTAYKSQYNPEGKFEYYMDNLNLDTLMSYNKETKGSNATNFVFEVLEPFSMGIFLQSLQLAAKEAGHDNYIESPYLLTIDFIGYDETGQPGMVPLTTRHLPFKFSNVGMEVTASGCKYKAEGYPWNEIALTDLHNVLKTDIGISGKTVVEILQTGKQSLQYAINHRLQEQIKKDKSKAIADEIVILFPKELASYKVSGDLSESSQGATRNPNQPTENQAVNTKLTINRAENLLLVQDQADVNELGLSSMGFDLTTGGQSSLVEDNFAFDEKSGRYVKGRVTFDPKSRMFMFAQGTSIVNAITEVMLMSEYCKKSIESNKNNNEGMKQWFRIETQVFNLESKTGNAADGRTPRLLVFKVVPYNVHSSRFTAPSSAPEGYENLKKQAAKRYDYIYTGQNTEVLNFNINLQTGFFTAVYADKNKNNKDVSNPQHVSQGGKNTTSQSPTNEDEGKGVERGLGQVQQGSQEYRYKNVGGGPNDDDRSLIAKQFHEALLNSPADLLTAELQILGDPYFIADSGMGNFSNTGTTSKFNLTKTGAVDYQSGEVDILLNFRTPIDIDMTTGLMDFGNTELVEGFSGLYQVIRVVNNFSNGNFTQTLELVRRIKQTYITEPTTEGQSSQRSENQVTDGGSATVNPSAPAPKTNIDTQSSSGSSTPLVDDQKNEQDTQDSWWW